MTQAGGKILPELHEKFAKYAKESGKKFIVMYGQCEATARMGYLPFEKAVEKKADGCEQSIKVKMAALSVSIWQVTV